jgi:hypothetical protein
VRLAWLALVGLAACADNTDPIWQLDHDRIIAVRVTPPHIPSGEKAIVDALMAHKGGPTDVEAPTFVTAPPHALPELATSVQPDGSIVAPDEAALAQARTELGLDPGAPVPFELAATFGAGPQPLIAVKSIYFGDAADNPALPPITVNGAAPVDGATLDIPFDVDVPLVATVPDPMWKVDWLTSCGTMHDDNEHSAFVHVQPADPTSGELAVVVRDTAGGVVWDRWKIQSAAPPGP